MTVLVRASSNLNNPTRKEPLRTGTIRHGNIIENPHYWKP
jgi:hypothetical protein